MNNVLKNEHMSLKLVTIRDTILAIRRIKMNTLRGIFQLQQLMITQRLEVLLVTFKKV